MKKLGITAVDFSDLTFDYGKLGEKKKGIFLQFLLSKTIARFCR